MVAVITSPNEPHYGVILLVTTNTIICAMSLTIFILVPTRAPRWLWAGVPFREESFTVLRSVTISGQAMNRRSPSLGCVAPLRAAQSVCLSV
ncbi:hypothetical protein E2C01_060662 [Portunus trituberculatus]|uniref:Uncharacterized protein n=1 Tax=Portunus trituberculatus TaxID=210409 RepID=A0A5B7HCR0_PORTR|nr:hypothetical protein [Portunus trituberculatus]